MDPADDDEVGATPWLPPEDRLWRHPSEVGLLTTARAAAQRARPTPWTIGLLSGTIGALLVASAVILASLLSPGPLRVVEQVAVPQASYGQDRDAIPEIAERVRPAIAQIETESARGRSSASGVVFRSDGHLLTTNHVVEGASSVRVVLADGREQPATVVGGDPETDIAVVKIEGNNYPTVVLGSAERLRVGQGAIAIGSPAGGTGGPSVSAGVVSSIGRTVDLPDGRSMGDMILTDAPVASGSSGGALLDDRGAVIGITMSIASDAGASGSSLALATPIDTARDVAEQLITTGRVVHVWLGVEGADVDETTAKRLGVDYGALVKHVAGGSPASAAGIAAGDVICTVAGTKVTSMATLVMSLRARRPGQVVTLRVMRAGKWADIKALLVARPASG